MQEAGSSLREIVEALGFATPQTAFHAIGSARGRREFHTSDIAFEYKTKHLAETSQLRAIATERLVKALERGDDRNIVNHTEMLIRIQDREARLTGCNTPIAVDTSTPVQMSDQELTRLIRKVRDEKLVTVKGAKR